MERTYRRSTRFSTYTHFEKDELEDIIDEIKKTGVIPKGKYISPPQIEPFLKDLYFRLQDMYEDVRNGNVDDSTKR
jgi:trans-aconitate methyltransferase